MHYCLLEEAYGKDFISSDKNQSLNPSRNIYLPGCRNGSEESNINSHNTRLISEKNSLDDTNSHIKTFDSDDEKQKSNNKIIRAWGDVENNEYITEENDQLSPKEFLKQSLLRNRNIKSPDITPSLIIEPDGYENNEKFKRFNNSSCDEFFNHIHNCKSCQKKMKKRLDKYIKNVSNKDNLDNYLFKEEDEKKVVEHFENIQSNKIFYLLFFGLFIIYVIDTIKK